MHIELVAPDPHRQPTQPPRKYRAELGGGFALSIDVHWNEGWGEARTGRGWHHSNFVTIRRDARPASEGQPAIDSVWVSCSVGRTEGIEGIIAPEWAKRVAEFVAGIDALLATERAIVDTPPAEVS